MTGSFFEPRDESDTQYILARLRSRFEQTTLSNVLVIVAFMLLGLVIGSAVGRMLDQALTALIGVASMDGFAAAGAGIVRLALPYTVILATGIVLDRRHYRLTLPDALLVMPIVALLLAAGDSESVAAVLPAQALGAYNATVSLGSLAAILLFVFVEFRRRRIRKLLVLEQSVERANQGFDLTK